MNLWTDMTKAIVVLHNFSIKGQENHSDIIETAYVGNSSKMINLGQVASNNYRKNTKRIRKITKSVSVLDLEQHPGKTT